MCALFLIAQSSSSVNKLWQSKTAHPSEILDFSNSTYDDHGNIYLTGNHTQDNGQIVLLLERFGEEGDIDWSEEWLCTGCYAAFGVDLTLVGDYIYVAGAVQPDTSSFSFDIVVQKYHKNTGNLLWSQTLDNKGSATEFPVDIAVNGNGTVFVTGTSQQTGTGYDVFVASYASSGLLDWQSTYDYAGYDETAARLRLLTNDSVQVLAASSSTATDWEAALLTYAPNGTMTDSLRSPSTNLDRDLPLTYHLEGDELFIGGSQLNATTSNQDAYLKKYTLTDSIAEVWTKSIDVDSRAETLLAIQRTPTGEIYATGGTADAQANNWTWLQRFGSDGSTIWRRLRTAAPAEDIISGRYFSLDVSGNILLAFNYKNPAGQKVHLAQYSSDGSRRWEVPLVSSADKAIASNLLVPNEKYIYVVGVFIDPTGKQFYHINKLEHYAKGNTIVNDSLGKPSYLAEDLLIRFSPCVVDTPFVNNHQLSFGKVKEVITDTALITQMDSLLGAGGTLENWRLFKVFFTFDTHVSTIKGRQGIDITAPPLWATFLLEIGGGAQIKEPPAVRAALDTIGVDKIRFSHPNYIGRSPVAPPPTPNDEFYDEQTSFFTANPGINMEPAWDILDNVTEDNWNPDSEQFDDGIVNIVLIDTGVRFHHDDLRCATCPGIVPPGEVTPSIVVEALGFPSGGSVMDLSNDDADTQDVADALNSPDSPVHGHGTRTAGILSAIKDNTIGVAGITYNSKHTVQLHSYRAAEIGVPATVHSLVSALGFVLNCENTQGVPCNEEIDLDLLCLEYAYDPSGTNNPGDPDLVELLREATELLYDAQYVQSTARGNFGLVESTLPQYPATYEDRWMISVGASGRNGRIVENEENTSLTILGFEPDNYSSNYGLDMDFIAPGINQLVKTTSNLNNSAYYNFNGTSAALPHVTGTAAQLMVHHRGPLAQEDVEHLLEYTASDVAVSGYDEENGWGLINAGNAIKFIDPDEDDHRVVQVEINGDLPVNNDPFGCGDDCFIVLDRPENDLASFDNGAYHGTIRKYSYEFAIDVTPYGSIPDPLGDPGMKPFWVRSSATNLWFTPEDYSGDKLFAPDNHLFFEGDPFFDGNILRGVIAGYAFTITGDVAEEPFSIVCRNGKEIASTSNPVDLHECYYGTPRLTFSFLVKDPILEENILITDVETLPERAEQKLTIYPNPTTGLCQVRFYLANTEDVALTVYNLAGRRLLNKTLHVAGANYSNTTLDLSNYPTGMYIVRVYTEQGVLTQKIIKQ